jgi:hypothetical protein
MRLISHRGNINGPNKSFENKPEYIEFAIFQDFDVEVDVWYNDGHVWLGHDDPLYQVDNEWFEERRLKLWIHCKNIESVVFFKEYHQKFNFFWHQKDDIALTSLGFLWTYPGKKLTKYSIAVLPENEVFEQIEIASGICSDYIERYKMK